MVHIICTKNDSNMTNKYGDTVPDGQKSGRTDGVDGRMHGQRKNISL